MYVAKIRCRAYAAGVDGGWEFHGWVASGQSGTGSNDGMTAELRCKFGSRLWHRGCRLGHTRRDGRQGAKGGTLSGMDWP